MMLLLLGVDSNEPLKVESPSTMRPFLILNSFAISYPFFTVRKVLLINRRKTSYSPLTSDLTLQSSEATVAVSRISPPEMSTAKSTSEVSPKSIVVVSVCTTLVPSWHAYIVPDLTFVPFLITKSKNPAV